MNNISRSLLAAAAIGASSLGSASAMPFSNLASVLGPGDVEKVHVVCNRYGRCYNTHRTYRSARRYYAPRYYYGPRYYAPHYGYSHYRYYAGPRVGVGVGPFGFGVW